MEEDVHTNVTIGPCFAHRGGSWAKEARFLSGASPAIQQRKQPVTSWLVSWLLPPML